MIKAAAIFKDGYFYTGMRHCDVFASVPFGLLKGPGVIQGFVTHDNKFVDRKEALIIALFYQQVIEKELHMPRTGLDSSDLY